MDRLENERHQHDGPTDEDRGRIEIGDRRATGNVDAGDQRECVESEREPEQPDRSAAKGLRPTYPGQDAENECETYRTARIVEGAELVEEDFEVGLSIAT